jgi:GABA permease
LTSHPGNMFANLTGQGGFTPHGWIAVFATVPTVFFAMTGAESVTIAAAESTNPVRAVAKMSGTVIWRILIFYVASILLIVSVTPWSAIRSGESPFTAALVAMRIPLAGTIMSAIILTAVLSCLNSAFYLSSRVLFVLASNRDAPRLLVRLNSRRVPVISVAIGSMAGVLGVVAATQAPQRVFDFLVSSSGAIMVFVYAITAIAQIRLRRVRERSGAAVPAISMWLFPYWSVGVVCAMGAVLVAMAWTPNLRSDLEMSGVSLLLAVISYVLVRRHRIHVKP